MRKLSPFVVSAALALGGFQASAWTFESVRGVCDGVGSLTACEVVVTADGRALSPCDLHVVWGAAVGGTSLASWEHAERVGRVDGRGATFTVPLTDEMRNLRVAFVVVPIVERQLESISVNSAYFDTQIVPTAHEVKMTYSVGDYRDDMFFFGTTGASSWNTYSLAQYSSRYYYGPNNLNGGTWTTGLHVVDYNRPVSTSAGVMYAHAVDGSLVYRDELSASDSAGSLVLGYRSGAANLVADVAYFAVIAHGSDAPAVELIPATDAEGKVCFCDTVRGDYVYNENVGATPTAGAPSESVLSGTLSGCPCGKLLAATTGADSAKLAFQIVAAGAGGQVTARLAWALADEPFGEYCELARGLSAEDTVAKEIGGLRPQKSYRYSLELENELGGASVMTGVFRTKSDKHVPADAVQLDCVTFASGTYVATGMIPSAHEIDVSYSAGSYVEDGHLFGTTSGNSHNTVQWTAYSHSYYYGPDNGHAGTWTDGPHELCYNRKTDDGYVHTFDGSDLYKGAISADDCELVIGSRSGQANFTGSVSSFKVIDHASGQAVLDLVPCQDSENVVCFYDMVSGDYLRPTGGTLEPGIPISGDSFALTVESHYGATAISPAAGVYLDVNMTEPGMEVSAPQFSYEDGVAWECVGYTLSTSADGQFWSDPVSIASRSYAYVKGVSYTHLIWLWRRAAHRLSVFAGPATAVVETDPLTTDGTGARYYGEGTEVAVAVADGDFVRWNDQVDEAFVRNRRILFRMPNAPVELTAYCRRDWLYSPAEGTMSDGYFTLNVAAVSDGLAVVSCAEQNNSPVLDLTKPIHDVDGEDYAVREIRHRAFYCDDMVRGFSPSFNELLLPQDLRAVGDLAFSGCKKAGGALTLGCVGECAIGTDAFVGCRIGSLVLGSGVRSVSGGAFYENGALTNLVVCEGVESVGQRAFTRCSIAAIDLPGSVTNVGQEAFYECRAVRTLRAGWNRNSEMSYVSESCPQGGVDMFAELPAMEKAELGPAMKILAQGTCYNCPLLGEVVTYATEIGPYCFYVPASGSGHGLTNLTFRGERPPTIGQLSFVSSQNQGTPIAAYWTKVFVPKGNAAWDAWIAKNVTLWKDLGELQAEYTSRYGETGKKPIGLTKDTTVPALQWIFYEPACGMMLLVL